jgi:opacity protein-like surface antigen
MVAGVASLALPVFAQENPGRHEFSAQALGSFTTTTTQNGIDNKSTNSGGVLGSYRFFFSKHHGVEANYAWSRSTQSYAGPGTVAGIKSDSHEIGGAYVFRAPLRNITPFALAGVSAVVFDPVNLSGVNTQTRAAFVYGAGADFNLSRHVFARAQYRGLVYNSPTWELGAFNGLDRATHRAEPSVGFGYRF